MKRIKIELSPEEDAIVYYEKTMGRNNSSLPMKIIFSNLWLTKPLVNLISKLLRGDLFALLHTTCAITKFTGSESYNVLPLKTTVGMNFRLLGKDTVEKAKKAINNL